MVKWQEIVANAANIIELQTQLKAADCKEILRKSIVLQGDTLFFMVTTALTKSLVIIGEERDKFEGEDLELGKLIAKIGPLSPENANTLREIFPWTKPQAFGRKGFSIGLGDRLGLASPGHIETILGTPVRPVLAQQSMRELELTRRTYEDVLNAASWAVFQEGYRDGFGADGDHLKNAADIKAALKLGFSMITLDCSEHIDDEIRNLSEAEILARYNQLPAELRSNYEALYKEQSFELEVAGEMIAISITAHYYYAMILTYYRALEFIEQIYTDVIQGVENAIDFEISIDEVATPTTPQDHFFVANELTRRQIEVSGVAPRFCGSFEKGIDYVGNREQFEAEFKIHAKIAEYFDYKLSVHSGSDKFSVFPIIKKYATKGFHVKTAGTNWLEAVRVIAAKSPALYRKLHAKSLASLEDAKKYYVVSLDLANIPNLAELSDEKLPSLLDNDDARQLLHINYGFILQDPELKEEVYETLAKHEGVYREFLVKHIGRHLRLLGF